jgi:hypothetical protein
MGMEASLVVASVANLKPATPLALGDDAAVPRAKFELSNVPAHSVNFLDDLRNALQAACIRFGLPFGTAFDKLQSSISV